MNADMGEEIEAFMAAQKLPASFRAAIEQTFAPLAAAVARRMHRLGRPAVVGLCGPQGSGKSTGAEVMRLLLQSEGLRVAVLSLDDLYLTRAERGRLASNIHPLLATRGPPGTHDLDLGNELLNQLLTGVSIALPSFDKATDDRRPVEQWTPFLGPADVVLFEGWCVGARPEPREGLKTPINALERELDAQGVWREFVNSALAQYQMWFSRIEFLILLQPPNIEVVSRWRREQEAKLREQLRMTRPGVRAMSDDEVNRFVQHYQRTTLNIMREMPGRADAVVELGPQRELRRLVTAP